MADPAQENVLYYGDNLDVLRRHVRDESVDLVYLDPPFNSNQNYNVLFAKQDGDRSAAQIKAFSDTWRWDQAASAALWETVSAGGQVAQTLLAFQKILDGSNMLAYLAMMAPRLVELRRVLRKTGSIYLHCDPTASHYLKLLMDSVYSSPGWQTKHPKLQLLTVSEILAGKGIDFPHQTASTFKRAPKHESDGPKSDPLF